MRTIVEVALAQENDLIYLLKCVGVLVCVCAYYQIMPNLSSKIFNCNKFTTTSGMMMYTQYQHQFVTFPYSSQHTAQISIIYVNFNSRSVDNRYHPQLFTSRVCSHWEWGVLGSNPGSSAVNPLDT